MAYLMAIDAGTGSIRAVVFDAKGNQLSIAQKEWHHLPEPGVAGSMNFDYEKNGSLLFDVVRAAIAGIDAKRIKAISSTSMREGIVLYDENKKEIFAVANVDARAGDEVRLLKERFGGIEEEFYKISGQTFALGALPRLLWLKRHRRDLYEKVRYLSMINDWVLFKLTGEIASEPSNAGTTGIFDLRTRQWRKDMAQRVGIKSDIFPPVIESGSVLATIREDVAKYLGLDPKTLVVVGGGDVQLGSVGLGVVHKGDVAILGGSFWQQVVNMDKHTPLTSMDIRFNPHILPDQIQAEAITFFSGLVMRWFRDAFCQSEKEEARRKGVDTYALLERKAKDVPVGSYGIMPIFSDAMHYDRWYHASPGFVGLDLDPQRCNKYTIFRSLEENAAIVSKINLDKIAQMTKSEISRVTFAGGASKGELWSAIVADVIGKPITVPVVKEATALGAAIAAGVGAGIYESFQEGAKEVVRYEKEIMPNMHNHEQYLEIAQKWQKIYRKERELVDEGLLQPMWKAPGL